MRSFLLRHRTDADSLPSALLSFAFPTCSAPFPDVRRSSRYDLKQGTLSLSSPLTPCADLLKSLGRDLEEPGEQGADGAREARVGAGARHARHEAQAGRGGPGLSAVAASAAVAPRRRRQRCVHWGGRDRCGRRPAAAVLGVCVDRGGTGTGTGTTYQRRRGRRFSRSKSLWAAWIGCARLGLRFAVTHWFACIC